MPAKAAGHNDALLPRIAVPLLIVLIGAAAYSNSFRGKFTLDDYPNIIDSSVVRSVMPSTKSLLGPPWTSYTGRPVAMFLLAVNYQFSGLSPLGYHVFNLLLHLACALAVWGIVRRTLRLPRLRPNFEGAEDLLATVIALIWVVHPLGTSAVTYISQSVEAMMALFYLLTLYCFIRSATVDSLLAKRVWAVLSIVSCLLGLFCKEPMASAPIVVLLYDRMLISDTFADAFRKRRGLYLGLAATWIPLGILLSMNPHGDSVGYRFHNFTALDYLKSQTKSIVTYLRQSVWPSGLVVYYGMAEWDVPVLRRFSQYAPWGVPVVALLALTVWGLVRRRPAALLGAAFFLILGPSSSIMPMPSEMIAEHRMYLPLVPVVILVVLGIYHLIRSASARMSPAAQQRLNWGAGFAAVGAVIALGITTYRRNALYESPLALWRDTLSKRPQSPTALGEVGRLELNEGNYAEGERLLRASIERWPQSVVALTAYGQLLEMTGRPADAIETYRLACSYASNEFLSCFIRLANLLVRQNQPDEATAVLKLVIQRVPTQETAHALLGAILTGQGDRAAGQKHFDETLRMVADRSHAHQIIADALIARGLLDDAITHLQEAARLAPGDSSVQIRLGTTYLSMGNPRLAIDHFNKALALAPNDLTILNNLAWIKATSLDPACRDGKAAVEHARRAVEITHGKNSSVLDTLATAYAENGQFDLAIQTAENALSLLPPNSPEIPDMRRRLDGYRQKQPFRDVPATTGGGG